ncbi:MAG TPA: ribonuclease III [Rhizomicrobium sp.]|nr:ribonuclease III [Rhizomicrobium sp.]
MSELEARLGHSFRDKDLLARALTHASASSVVSNERLEFLGDRVLGLVIAEKLHHLFPQDPEGILALKLNALVRSEACARAAEKVGLGEFLVLAQSEIASGGRKKAAILAGGCEAVIAALYLDGGFAVARAFIEKNWEEQFSGLGRDMRDAKTALQEWSQAKKGGAAPVYRLIKREGPDHAPRFAVEVSVAGQESVTGEGGSKREAEQAAARAMLAKLEQK